MAEIVAASDRSLLVVFGNTISAEHHTRVMDLLHRLQRRPLPGVTSLSPAYASLLLRFDPLRVTGHSLELRLRGLLRETEHESSLAPAEAAPMEIPVCYEAPYAPDLPGLAAEAGLTEDKVVALHSAPVYLVYFLGFAPGFGYMGEVDARIALPRFASPRAMVAAGSVGIAGRQTGIYPLAIPGGWRLIGRCPLQLVEAVPGNGIRTLLEPGRRVKFKPISRTEFENQVEPCFV